MSKSVKKTERGGRKTGIFRGYKRYRKKHTQRSQVQLEVAKNQIWVEIERDRTRWKRRGGCVISELYSLSFICLQWFLWKWSRHVRASVGTSGSLFMTLLEGTQGCWKRKSEQSRLSNLGNSSAWMGHTNQTKTQAKDLQKIYGLRWK